MASQQPVERDVRVHARNIGGIDEAEVSLPPGVTVLTGRNATNRTSFLQAIMAGLGSERASLKGDADEGEVELQVGDETYTRTLTRSGDTVVYGGDPYLDDPQVADQFAFLLENTEVRRAVARGDDLREIIMDPVDTEEIESQIRELENEKRDLDNQIKELERIEHELPELEAEKQSLEADLEEAREELADVEAEIEEKDVSLEQSRSQKEAIEEAFEALRDAQSDLEDVEFELETEQQTLEDLRDERDQLEAELDDVDEHDENPDRLAGRIDELRERKRALDDTISQLGSVINFNEEMLDGEGLDLDEFGDETDSDADPTQQLLGDAEDVVCWTCGSEVERDHIEGTVDHLRDLRAEKLDERSDLDAQIDDLSSTRSEIQRQQRERERTERRLSEVENEIEATEKRIDSLENSLEDQREEVQRLEAETEDAGTGGDYDEVLELHRKSNEVELRVDRLESDLEDVESSIADHEETLGERDELAERRDEIDDELTDLRTKVDRIEAEAVEEFNDHMESVLAVLEYDNIERIWVERREREVREGRRKVEKTTFDLHIIRATDDGTSYRDTIDHLSESEREVTGLVFALAGYLVHEVYEDVPFMVLDSLEAIDSDRIARVVEYFSDYADYLTVALLPEDAQALDDDYAYVEQID
ncbi:archaea-specific SMC-related protein [Halobacterium sp. KA-6]|uniref:archaea-specific SMC-related protein n=1 Tax=Halobacterium sp. KA-6 TaxID=2896368 RepID=UPI001E63EB91|nr:archaea-specific SMC-related protein [Halobacterium sp. KA-6]MCD2203344.1 chromosome segregation protein SMC [Halobacterium sp. KA-6]